MNSRHVTTIPASTCLLALLALDVVSPTQAPGQHVYERIEADELKQRAEEIIQKERDLRKMHQPPDDVPGTPILSPAAPNNSERVNARYDKIAKDAVRAWNAATAYSSFNAKMDAYQNALNLFRQQQALRDGPNVQDAIAQVNALILWTSGVINDQNKNYRISVSELLQAYNSRRELFNEENFNYMVTVEVRFRSSVPSSSKIYDNWGNVVDATYVPSGLSGPVEKAIDGIFSNAPSGVRERARKGFQAIAVRDWKVAKAWFQDALNLDPDNVNLKRYVALVSHGIKDYGDRSESLETKQKSAIASLNENASSLSTEQIIKALDAFVLESYCDLCPANRYP